MVSAVRQEGRLDAWLCRPLWRLQRKWDERNLDTPLAKWVRAYSNRHCLLGALIQASVGIVVGPSLFYLLSAGRAIGLWVALTVGATLIFVPWLTFYNHCKGRNGFE
jgi:hypothetical protein